MNSFEDYLKNVGEVGYVKAVMPSMIYASGLPKARVMELVVAETGQRGIIQSLLPDTLEILMLDGRPVRHGTALARTNEILRIPVGEQLLGRSIDPFVVPIDGGKPFYPFQEFRDYDAPAPPIFRRSIINEPLHTGVAVVDFMVPIGKGQRELVLGDQKSGKTTFLLQTIQAQAKQNTVCIYVAIGKKKTFIKRTEAFIKETKLGNNVILVAADASSPASYIYLAPYTAMTIAEYFRDSGKDVLLVFDGLNNHAKQYREIALLSKRTPGREAYPGDIFYLHSHLVERAGKVVLDNGNVASITLLASLETVGGDITGYIQTNAMSMTDGHIYFDLEAFQEGHRPAVNVSLSVSRVGFQTQPQLAKELSAQINLILSEYTRAQGYARFGVELSAKTQQTIQLGQQVTTLFNQDQATILSPFMEATLFGLLFAGFWNNKPENSIRIDKIILQMAYEQGKLANIEAAFANITTLEAFIKQVQTVLPQLAQFTQTGLA